ncbi:hypothetical protein H5P92_004442, partial [Salmonella enterica]|nr:hypothetical protein [Salmonella enterica]
MQTVNAVDHVFLERDTKELNLAQRLIKACEEGIEVYRSGDLIACYRKALLKRVDPPHYFPRSYFVNQVNRFIAPSFAPRNVRVQMIDDKLTQLVDAGF